MRTRPEYAVVSGKPPNRYIRGTHCYLSEAERHRDSIYDNLDELWRLGLLEELDERRTGDFHTNWDRLTAKRHGEEPAPSIITRRVTDWSTVKDTP